MFKEKSISSIYAKIIFKIAKKKKNFSSWEFKLKFFSSLINIKKLQPIFLGFLHYKDSYKKFISLCHCKLNFYDLEIIKSLFELKKIFLIKKIFKEYKILKNKYLKNIKLEIISSYKFNKKYKKNLKEYFLNIFSNSTISLKYLVKKDLIGGMIFKIDNLIIDFSIKHQLKDLSQNLSQ